MALSHPALFALCLAVYPLFALAQVSIRPDIYAPTEVSAGTPTVATILPVKLYNNDPKFVSSYTLYLTAAATSGRLGLGSAFLHEQCEFLPPYLKNSLGNFLV